MPEHKPDQFWPLSQNPDFEALVQAANTVMPLGFNLAEAAAGLLLQSARSHSDRKIVQIIGREAKKQRTLAAHAYSETLLLIAHAGHRLEGTEALDLASEIARLRLYDLADISRQTHPRLLEIFEEEAVNSPEDFMNQNLINLLPQDLQPEATGIIKAYEHFRLLVEKLNAQKITKFRKPQA